MTSPNAYKVLDAFTRTRTVNCLNLTVRQRAGCLPRSALDQDPRGSLPANRRQDWHLPGCPDARILLVDHKGAKSGTKRTSPLMYLEDGDVFAVVASKAGQPTNPGWFYNLRANPDTAIQVGSVVRQVRARVATDQDRDRLWPKFVASYPGYNFFQSHAKGRKIPIVILDPR
ncbi:MAG: nitroreductase/quinone reductase family protein [Acidimicrobiales bacterium]